MFGNWLLVPRMLHLRYPHYTPVIKSQKNWEQLERTLKIEKKKNWIYLEKNNLFMGKNDWKKLRNI